MPGKKEKKSVEFRSDPPHSSFSFSVIVRLKESLTPGLISVRRGGTTRSPRGEGSLEKGDRALSSLKLCREDKPRVSLLTQGESKPMRGGAMETWGREPRG